MALQYGGLNLHSLSTENIIYTPIVNKKAAQHTDSLLCKGLNYGALSLKNTTLQKIVCGQCHMTFILMILIRVVCLYNA